MKRQINKLLESLRAPDIAPSLPDELRRRALRLAVSRSCREIDELDERHEGQRPSVGAERYSAIVSTQNEVLRDFPELATDRLWRAEVMLRVVRYVRNLEEGLDDLTIDREYAELGTLRYSPTLAAHAGAKGWDHDRLAREHARYVAYSGAICAVRDFYGIPSPNVGGAGSNGPSSSSTTVPPGSGSFGTGPVATSTSSSLLSPVAFIAPIIGAVLILLHAGYAPSRSISHSTSPTALIAPPPILTQPPQPLVPARPPLRRQDRRPRPNGRSAMPAQVPARPEALRPPTAPRPALPDDQVGPRHRVSSGQLPPQLSISAAVESRPARQDSDLPARIAPRVAPSAYADSGVEPRLHGNRALGVARLRSLLAASGSWRDVGGGSDPTTVELRERLTLLVRQLASGERTTSDSLVQVRVDEIVIAYKSGIAIRIIRVPGGFVVVQTRQLVPTGPVWGRKRAYEQALRTLEALQ